MAQSEPEPIALSNLAPSAQKAQQYEDENTLIECCCKLMSCGMLLIYIMGRCIFDSMYGSLWGLWEYHAALLVLFDENLFDYPKVSSALVLFSEFCFVVILWSVYSPNQTAGTILMLHTVVLLILEIGSLVAIFLCSWFTNGSPLSDPERIKFTEAYWFIKGWGSTSPCIVIADSNLVGNLLWYFYKTIMMNLVYLYAVYMFKRFARVYKVNCHASEALLRQRKPFKFSDKELNIV